MVIRLGKDKLKDAGVHVSLKFKDRYILVSNSGIEQASGYQYISSSIFKNPDMLILANYADHLEGGYLLWSDNNKQKDAIEISNRYSYTDVLLNFNQLYVCVIDHDLYYLYAIQDEKEALVMIERGNPYLSNHAESSYTECDNRGSRESMFYNFYDKFCGSEYLSIAIDPNLGFVSDGSETIDILAQREMTHDSAKESLLSQFYIFDDLEVALLYELNSIEEEEYFSLEPKVDWSLNFSGFDIYKKYSIEDLKKIELEQNKESSTKGKSKVKKLNNTSN